MPTSYFKVEDKLNDSSNFVAWKARLDLTLEENDVMGYVEGKVPERLKNATAIVKSKYKEGEIKAKKIIIDSLKDPLITYVSNMKKSKEMYDKLTRMHELNNLSHIITLKDQLKDIKMNEGKTIQAYFMRISQVKELLSIGEIIADRELVLVTLGGLPMYWETFITTISNNDKLPTFDELLGKCTQEESKMISRGRIQKHEEGEPIAFSAEAKKKKEKGRP